MEILGTLGKVLLTGCLALICYDNVHAAVRGWQEERGWRAWTVMALLFASIICWLWS